MNRFVQKLASGMRTATLSLIAAGALVVTTTAGAQAEPLRVGYLKFVTFGGIAVADMKGWFEDAGLDVELVLFDSGPPLLEAMASGSLDLGALGGVPTIRTASQEVFPFKVLSVVADVSSSLKIVATSEIETMQDLRGKTISLPYGTTQHLVFAKALEQSGMSVEDTEMVPMESIDGQAAFVAGRLDATIPVPASLDQVLAARADSHVLFENSDFDPPVRVFDVWIAPDTAMDERAEDIARTLEIWHDQVVPYLAQGNLDELQTWVNKVLGTKSDKAEIQEKLDNLTRFDGAEMSELASSGEFRRILTDQAAFMANVGIIPKVPDFDVYLDTSAISD